MTRRQHIRLILLGAGMMLLTLGFKTAPVRAQYTNEFSIGEYVDFLSADSIRVYFNCTGKVCRQSCASFYRTGRIDRERISMAGRFRDYYMNDSPAFEAVMDSGYLQGMATYYYPDGGVLATGHYRKGQRTGIWKYYYANGNLHQVLNYVQGFPFVSAYFNDGGRQLVTDGNGKYEGEFATYRSCSIMRFKGKVVSGVLNGRIKIYNGLYRGVLGYENYENGKFISGVSGSYHYSDAPKIELPGYNVHEELMLDENTIYCPGFLGTQFMKYDGQLYWQFYNEFLDSIHRTIQYKVEDQWLAIGISVSQADKLYDVSVFSSKDDYRLERDLFQILIGMKQWEAAQVFWSKIDSDLFFTLLITRGRVIIPAELMRQKGVY